MTERVGMIMGTNQSTGADASWPAVSAIVTAEGDGQGMAALLEGYLEALAARGEPFELICVFDHASPEIAGIVRDLGQRWPMLTGIGQRPWSGEDGALKVGIDRAMGDILLTLPGWSEIAASEIPRLLDALGEDDMVTGVRREGSKSGLQRARMGVTHSLISFLFGQRFQDVFCRARAGRAEAFRKIADLGVRQHFLPVVAAAEGYRVSEISLAPETTGAAPPTYSVKIFGYISAFIDILTLYVGLKFLRRPLRFFGAIGLPLLLVGALITAWLIVSRLFLGEALADRPALVFSVMMMVLGVQILALGLIGEIVIFSSSRRMRTYEIETIIRGRPEDVDTLAEPGSAPPQDR